ncbi:MAG: NUDIX domain-containing protein [Spirochaetaceae bacterium]|nr:NUDIX domain-containing protein [Spirochaetaceae bacterium]
MSQPPSPALLLKSLVPGLLPLIVFVAADAVFGETIGLAIGLAVGLGEFLWSLIKDKRPDPFVAADTLLLALAGGLSLALRNEIFFKLKPAIVELLLAAAMGVLLVLPPAYLKGYLGRQLRGIELPESSLPAMKKSLGWLLGVLFIHVALTVYAALALSSAAWGFVSGGLLYILFGTVALVQFVSARRVGGRRVAGRRAAGRHAGGVEMLPLVDDEGKVVGSASREECHRGPGKTHPVVRLLVFDSEGRMYLQKRAATRQIQPGKWDCAVGGHVSVGEDLSVALSREMREEIGITSIALEAAGAKPEPLLRFRWDSEIESELVFTFGMRYEGPFAPDLDEVEEGRFWERAEIGAAMGKGILTPLLERELAVLSSSAAKASAAKASAAKAGDAAHEA